MPFDDSIQQVAHRHANAILSNWKTHLDATLIVLQDQMRDELLRINDQHIQNLANAQQINRLLRRQLEVSNVAQQQMYNDASGWKNKWAKSEGQCAMYKQSLDKYQSVFGAVAEDRRRLLAALHSLKMKADMAESKTREHEQDESQIAHQQVALQAEAHAATCMLSLPNLHM